MNGTNVEGIIGRAKGTKEKNNECLGAYCTWAYGWYMCFFGVRYYSRVKLCRKERVVSGGGNSANRVMIPGFAVRLFHSFVGTICYR